MCVVVVNSTGPEIALWRYWMVNVKMDLGVQFHGVSGSIAREQDPDWRGRLKEDALKGGA